MKNEKNKNEVDSWRPKVKGEIGFETGFEFLQHKDTEEWLIDGIMACESFAVLFGDPGSYKSFLGLDMSLCISQGIKFHGRSVKQNPVALVIGEGKNGFKRRMLAWMEFHEIKILKDFYICSVPAKLSEKDSAEFLGKKIDALPKKPGVVLIDTLARNFGAGDESSTTSMNDFVNNIKEFIGSETCVFLIHHTGHGNKKRARGSSALLGALDSEYLLESNNGFINFSCTKQKDDEGFKPISFVPDVIQLSSMPGKTSVVLREIKPKDVRSPKEKVLDYVSEQGYTLSNIKEKFSEFGYKDDKSFGSALSRMKKKGEVFEENGKIFINNDFEEKE